ncbi:MAG: sulfatase-like hydrolase/transferase, partial [Lentisphaerae bacterium]|nr:sulfatase-like hydrolase/transferase [Lentisphaerota bacterium]
TRLENYFCTCPVSSPARATILTGRIPSQHGVHDFIRIRQGRNPLLGHGDGKAIEYLDGQTAYTDILAENGYTCGLSGKWHVGDECRPQKSFSFWRVNALGNGPYRRTPMVHEDGREPEWDTDYFTKVVTDNAITFMDAQTANDSPFYLSCHYTAPHSPWGRDQHPEETFDRYCEHCAFDTIPDVPLNPTQMQRPWLNPDGSNRRELLSGYFAAIEEMDKEVGRVLDWLDEHGLRENTLVFYTSDNGMNMGHHGIFGKGNGTYPLNMYDTSVKVPCIVSWPSIVPEGQTRRELLSHYDVFPTLLDMAGVPGPEDASLPPSPGRSFAPLLRGESMPETDCVVVHHEYGLVRMIRSHDWKYVHRHPWGPNELYDLTADPGEITNLAEVTEHAERIMALKGKLDAWFAAYADPNRDGLHEPVAGTGQINVVGPNAEGATRFMPRPAVIEDLTSASG